MQLPFTIVVEPPTRAELRRVGRFWWVGAIVVGLIVVELAVAILASPLPWRQPDPSATLDVQTVPDGATVDLDGRVRGLTPAQLALPPGGHHVTLRRDGYADASYDVTLSGGQTTSLVTDLWLQSPEVDELRPPFPGAAVASADFLRDGRVVLTVTVGTDGDRQAWLVDGRGGSQRIGPSTGADGLAVSPDGTRVAYFPLAQSQTFGTTQPAEIWVAGGMGAQPEHLDLSPPRAARLDDLSWGPDGQHLLVISHVPQPAGGQNTRLLWVNVVGGQSRELITIPSAIVPGSYRWSPDGQQVTLLTQTDQLTSLCLIGLRDGDFHYLADLGRDSSPAYPFAPVAWSSDGQHLVYTALPPEHGTSAGWPFAAPPASRLIVADATQPLGRSLGPTGLIPIAWDGSGRSAGVVTLAQPTRNGPLLLRQVDPSGGTRDLLELSLRPTAPFAARWDVTHEEAIVAVRNTSGLGGSPWDYWLVNFAPEVLR